MILHTAFADPLIFLEGYLTVGLARPSLLFQPLHTHPTFLILIAALQSNNLLNMPHNSLNPRLYPQLL